MSAPSDSVSSLDSTLVDSPKFSDLKIKDVIVSDEDKATAASLKEQANAAFKGIIATLVDLDFDSTARITLP